jgi:hypothetical protein
MPEVPFRRGQCLSDVGGGGGHVTHRKIQAYIYFIIYFYAIGLMPGG